MYSLDNNREAGSKITAYSKMYDPSITIHKNIYHNDSIICMRKSLSKTRWSKYSKHKNRIITFCRDNVQSWSHTKLTWDWIASDKIGQWSPTRAVPKMNGIDNKKYKGIRQHITKAESLANLSSLKITATITRIKSIIGIIPKSIVPADDAPVYSFAWFK